MLIKTNRIKEIKINSIELNNEQAAIKLKERLINLQLKKEELIKKRMELYTLETIVQKEEEALKPILPLLDIEYEMDEIEDKIHNECNILINNPTDARYETYK